MHAHSRAADHRECAQIGLRIRPSASVSEHEQPCQRTNTLLAVARRTTAVVAAVSMTVQLRDGRAGYWEAVQADHVDEPDALRVMREHAALQGCDFFVLSPARINANLVEHKNRLSVFYLQLSAAQFDSAELESQLLMALSEGAASVKELTGRVAHSAGKVRVAAVRLWKRRLVNLPMSTQLLSDDWAVTRCGHALA